MKHAFAFPLLLSLALGPLAAAQDNTPRIHGTLEGSRTAVFESPKDSCVPNDIPDVMARAWRDSTGTIHFVADSSDMYQSLGATLETLRHSCAPAFQSANDPNAADFNDQVWLSSFYTLDGKKIGALSHTEYHGWSHPGECYTQNIFDCEYDSDTYHQSDDGGYHFDSFKVPNNLVAQIPYKYEIDRGAVGYSVDTNIVEYGGWYYAVITDDGSWPLNCSGSTGPNHCLIPGGAAPMRTTDVFDPSSWRAWGGADFSVSFVDPYLGPVSHPEEHVYTPVPYMTFVEGLNLYQPLNVLVATVWNGYTNEYGPKGLYLTTSTDLVNWSKPTLVVSQADLMSKEPKGNWTYAYFSLIDPTAPDLNFSLVGDKPYLYYVRLDDNNSPYARVLFRQPVTLEPAN